ncbi:MAG TPA: hypothetical protein VIJ11_11235, partial [Galbitalea sp.]
TSFVTAAVIAAPSAIPVGAASTAADVDIVLDYLWGKPAEAAIMPLLRGRDDRTRLLSWLQIGAVAGPEIALPSAALRQANIDFLGSGQGSVSALGIVETLPELVDLIDSGTLALEATTRPLSTVEDCWTAGGATERIVLTP